MTLHSDVAALLAEAGITDVDVDEALADEHVRTTAYLRVVSVLADAESRDRDRDRETVATILRDPHELGAKTAVVALVDSVAIGSAGPAEFRQWATALLPKLDRFEAEGHRAFIRRRIQDWDLCLAVGDGQVPGPAELTEATDWMQRKLAEESESLPVLDWLAESGSTRKVRNLAKNRAGSRRPKTA